MLTTTRVVWLLNLFRQKVGQKEGSNWATGKVWYKLMRKSDWYRDRAADSDRKARATTKPTTRDRPIKDRDGWLEIAASVDARDVDQNQTKSERTS